MFNKNQIVEVTIEDIGINGEGIGKIEGFPLFVKDAVAGDRVLARITRPKKTYAYARVEKIISPSPDRIEPECPMGRQCGGCQLQSYSYEAELKYKAGKVRNNLLRIGRVEPELLDAVTEPIIGMDEPCHYRNKAQYPVGYDRDGNLIAGFYANHSHRIVPVDTCLLNYEGSTRIMDDVLDYMKVHGVSAYDEETGRGLVRHVLVRYGARTGEWMVCLVVNARPGTRLPNEDSLTERLAGIPGMTSISINYNTENTNVIMGGVCENIRGSDHITDYIGDVRFEISPLAFYQVNPVQTEKLYGKALEYAACGLSGESISDTGCADRTDAPVIWDMYCGIGTITLFLARGLGVNGKVYGVEVIPQAIDNARKNAADNGIDNVEFYVGMAEDVLPKHYEMTGEGADIIVVDPPRKGCDTEVLNTMMKMAPERIVYVSCDSATLARDVKILREGLAGGDDEADSSRIRYEIKRVCPVDMFPRTVHVETVALLSRK